MMSKLSPSPSSSSSSQTQHLLLIFISLFSTKFRKFFHPLSLSFSLACVRPSPNPQKIGTPLMTISHFHVFALIVSLHSTLSLSFYSTRTYILSLSLSHSLTNTFLPHFLPTMYHTFAQKFSSHLRCVFKFTPHSQ